MNKKLLYLKRLALGLCLAFCSANVFADVYLNETFDALGSDVPAEWSHNGDIDAKYQFTATDGGYSGRCLRFDSRCGGGALCTDQTMKGKTDVLMTPAVTVEGNVMVSFRYRNPAGGEFAVYASRDNGATYLNNVVLAPVTGVANWAFCEVAVPAQDGDKFKLVFVATSNASYPDEPAYIYVDEVKIEDVPTCAKPTGLAISEATPTEVTLAWQTVANAGAAPSFFTLDLYANGVKVREEKANELMHVLTNLTPGTAYTVVVQGDCNYAYQLVSAATTLDFVTPCKAGEVPYEELFDSQVAGTPSCWTVGGSHASLPALQKTHRVGATGAALRIVASAEKNAYAVSPLLSVTDMESLEIAFQGYTNDHSQKLEVGVMTNPYDFSTYIPVGEVNFEHAKWNGYVVNTAVLKDYGMGGSGDIYVVLNAEAGQETEVFVDRFTVVKMGACPRPTNFKVNSVTATEAVLSWTENATPTKRVLTLKQGETTTTVEATSNPFTLTGLTANADYTVTLKLECSSETSLETPELAFTTVCAPTTIENVYIPQMVDGQLPTCWIPTLSSLDKSNGVTYPVYKDGYYDQTIYENVPGGLMMKAGNMLAFCDFGVPANTLRVFFAAAYTPSNSAVEMPMNLEVGVMTNPHDPATFEVAETIVLEEANASESFEILLNSVQSTGHFIAFRASDACRITNIKVDVIPSCISPKNVRLVGYDQTTATFAWDARGGVTKFKVQLGELTTTVENVSEATLTNLTPGTDYNGEVVVTSICGGEEGEACKQGVSFTTLCEPLTITAAQPYITKPCTSYGGTCRVPDCWVVVEDGNDDGYNTLFDNPYGRITMALPPFTNSLSDLRITITGTTYNGHFAVGYLTNVFDNSTFVEIGQMELGKWEVATGSVTFPEGIPAGATMALRLVLASGNSGDSYITDLKVDLKPNCSSTVKVVNHETTTNSISVTLGQTQGESQWEVLCVPATQSPDALTGTIISQQAHTFTDLEAGTAYMVYVRPVCGENSISEWAEGYPVSTTCAEQTIPYLMDFSKGISACYTVTGEDLWKAVDGAAKVEIMSYGGEAVMITEGINVPEGQAASLSFRMSRTAAEFGSGWWGSEPNNNVMNVYVNSQPSLNDATLLLTINNAYNKTPVETAQGMYTYSAAIQQSGKLYIIFEQELVTTEDAATIDDIRLEAQTGCYTPFISSVSGQTTTSAVIKAQASPDATEFNFTIGSETRTSTTNTITWTGLTADTDYSVTVTAKCGDTTTETSAPYKFRTRCNPLSIPYTDNFEAATTSKDCWILTTPFGDAPNAYEGSGAVLLNGGSSYILPELTMTDVRNYELSFMVYGMDINNQFNVGVLADPSDVASFSTAKVITVKEKAMWREVIVTFEDVVAGHENDKFIAFNLPIGQAIVLDNVKVCEKPACQKVTNLDVVVYGDELDVTWESKGEKTELALWKMGELIKSEIVTNDATAEQQKASLKWVEQNESGYNFKARSICGNDTSEWTIDFIFETPCNRMPLPYNQTFENLGVKNKDVYNLEDYLSCWNRLVVYRNGSTQIHPSLKFDDTKKYTIGKVSLNIWAGDDGVLITLPEFEKPVGELSMTFQAYCNGAEGDELDVIVMKSLNQPDDYQVVTRIPKVGSGFTEFEVHFTGYEGRYIGFHAVDGVNYFIDNIEVTETPKSLRPTGLTPIAVDETTATVTVTDPSANTAWEIIMVPAGSAMDESLIQTANQKENFVYTGLKGGNIYDAYVRGVNGDAKSKWVKAENLVRTDCASGSIRPVFGESFEEAVLTANSILSMYISDCWTLKQIDAGVLGSGTDWGNDAWSVSTGHVYAGKQAAVLFKGAVGARTLLISPKLQILEPNAYEVCFNVYRQEGNVKDLEGVRVWVNTTKDTVGGTLLTYVPHYVQTAVPGGVATETEAGYYEYSAVIPTADNSLYVIFEGISQGGADLYLDNVVVRPIPSCRRPERVEVADAAPTSVTLNIVDPVGSAWDVVIMKRDSLMEDGYQPVVSQTVTTKNPTLEGVVSAESYDVYVRSNCGDEVSEWTRPAKFMAPCEAITVTKDASFKENWEGFEKNTQPTCWTVVIMKKGSSAAYNFPRVYNYAYYAPEGEQTLIMNQCMIASPEFTNDVRELTVSFTTRGYYNVEVGVMTNPNDMSTYTPVALSAAYQSASVGATSQVEHEVSLASYTGPEAHYFTLRNLDATSIYLDLLEVTLADPCFRIENVNVSDLTANSARVFFSDARSQFDYALVEAGGAITSENIINSTELSHVFTGLNANTSYEVYVRAYCEGEPGAWSKPVAFTTLCAAETVTDENPSIIIDGPNQTLGCYTLLQGKAPSYYSYYKSYTCAYDGFDAASDDYYKFATYGFPEYTNDLADLQLEVTIGSDRNREIRIGTFKDGVFTKYGSVTVASTSSVATISLAPLAGKEGTPAVQMGYSTVYVKTLKVQMGPAFYAPILSATEVLDTKATITANGGRNAKSYTWKVDGVEVTGNEATLTLTGLTPKTSYKVQAKANDGTTDSEWSEELTITTQDVIPVTATPVLTVKAVSTEMTVTAKVDATTTSVEYAVVLAGVPVDENVVKTATAANGVATFTETGLEVGVEYDIHVRAVGADKSYWAVVTKKTLCDLGGLPYAEDFESYTEGVSTDYPNSWDKFPAVPAKVIYPECWNVIGGERDYYGDIDYAVYMAQIEGMSKEGASLWACPSTVGNDVYIVLPALGYEANELNLSISYMNERENDQFEVGVMSNPNDGSTFYSVHKPASAQNWATVQVDFSNVPEGYEHIAIKMKSDVYRTWFDDIRVSCLGAAEEVTATVCEGDGYTYAGIAIQPGQLVPGENKLTYTVPATDGGCDKVYNFTVNVETPAEMVIYKDTICPDQTEYDNYGIKLTNPTTGKYYIMSETEGVCPQTIRLELTVAYPTAHIDVTVCEDELAAGYHFDLAGEDKVYTEPGIYELRTASLTTDCDSVIYLDLKSISSSVNRYREICEGDSVLFHGKQYSATGEYVHNYGIPGVCGDSVEVLHLTVLPTTIVLDTTICPNGRESDGIYFGDRYITKPGTYTRTYENKLECGVTETWNVTLEELNKVTMTDYVCYNEDYEVIYDNMSYETIKNVTESQVVRMIVGATNTTCGDSLILNLIVEKLEPVRKDTVVNELPFLWGDITVASEGEWNQTFMSQHGCDSTVILNVKYVSSINIAHAGELTLRPNPVEKDQVITVDYNFSAQEREGMIIEVVNSLGQVVRRQTAAEVVVVEPIQVSGFYTVRFITGEDTYYTAKILVK